MATHSPDPPLDRTAPGRERARERLMAKIPRWYNPWLHLAASIGTGLGVLVIALFNLHDVRPLEWLVVPAVFFAANGFEWFAHKRVLHRRFWPFGEIYERHTPGHHAVYMNGDMEIRSPREFRLVLLPAAGVLGLVAVVSPPAYVLAQYAGINCGWLLLVTASLYMVGYEVSHLSYHLRANGRIGRLRLVRVLREHHERHHDPSLMRSHNFNVTIPFFDWIRGTIARRH